MKDIPKKRGLFGENSNIPFVGSTEQVVHFKGTVGTTLDEVINDIDTSKVGEVYMSDGGTLTPMTTTDKDGKKITILPKDQFGKVEDVKLNGASILNSDNVANINIAASVSNTTGTPTVTPIVNEGNVILNFNGIKGGQGDSAIWDENEPHEKLTDIANSFGDSTVKPMSQKVVTDELQGIEQNYKDDVYLDYSTKQEKTKAGWGIYKEPIPCTAGQSVVWNHGVYMSGVALVFYNANSEAISSYGTQSAGPRTITAPANTAFVNGSFLINVNGVKNTTPLKVDGVSYSIIDKYEGINEKITNLQDRMEVVEEAASNIPELEGETGQSETSGMTQKAITDAIGELESEILDGVDSNYIKDKYFKFSNEPTGIPEDKAGCGVFKENIPITNNSNITWRFGLYNIGALVIFDGEGNAIYNAGANDTYQRGIAKVNIPANAASLNCSFQLSNVTIPITVDGVDYPIVNPIPSLKSMADYDDVKGKVEDLENIVKPNDTQHGFIGKYFPAQIKEINDNLGDGMDATQKSTYFKRLQFLHVSDNHANTEPMGYAPQFLSYCPAEFLINTGDLVVDSWNTSEHRSVDAAVAASKPVYFAMGNHDYYKAPSHQDVFDNYYGVPEVSGTLNHHNSELGGVVTDKTYYSFNHSASKVKCIILDMNDGWPDENLSSRALADFSVGKMSQEQIEWFISELQSAKTNDYHVCIFMHILPATIDKGRTIMPFTDNVLANTAIGLSFLHDLVDGFINGGTVSFTYDGNDYSATFSAGGAFVAWFTGHTHWDTVGWLKDYPKQFAVIVTRPNARQMWDGSVWDSNITKFNFVTIDTAQNSLSIYRVGQQKTVWGVDRKSFRIFYK